MIHFCKILNSLTRKYVFNIIPVLNDSCYNTRAQSTSKLSQFDTRTKTSGTVSFPSVLNNGTSWMIKSEICHPSPDSKNRF